MEDKSSRLLLTGDDLGMNTTVNAAIEEWHRAGAIHRAGLMVNEADAGEALVIARRNPGLRVGLHLTLCGGLDSGGRPMKGSPAHAGLRFAFFPGARAWLRREIEAQFAKFMACGLVPEYWDGHTHLHLHPVVLQLTLPVALKHGFRFTRLVREPSGPGFLPLVFSWLSAKAGGRLRAAGVGFADALFGLTKSGRMDLDEVARAMRSARERRTEIYFHPGAEVVLRDPREIARLVRAG